MFLVVSAEERKMKQTSERITVQSRREYDSADILRENIWRYLSIMAPIVYYVLGAKRRGGPRRLNTAVAIQHEGNLQMREIKC